MRHGLLLTVAVGLVGMLCAGFGCQRPPTSSPVPPPLGGPQTPGTVRPTPFIVRGHRCPPVRTAAEADLSDEAPVVGVLVGGTPRASVLSALCSPLRHGINDLVGDTPVTIAYCNQSDCLRAYTADTPGVPLPVDLGGWDGKAMMLRMGNKFYWQESGKASVPGAPELPCRSLPFQRTTWGEWKKAHPDTDVFTGAENEPRRGFFE